MNSCFFFSDDDEDNNNVDDVCGGQCVLVSEETIQNSQMPQ